MAENETVQPKGSTVWKWFEKCPTNGRKAICKLCDRPQDRSGGSTTNMIKHLENVHKINPGCRKRPHSSPQKQKELRPPPTSESRNLDRLFTEWVCADFQAFQVCENEHFKRFIKALKPDYI